MCVCVCVCVCVCFGSVMKCFLFSVGCHVTCPKIFRGGKHRAAAVS